MRVRLTGRGAGALVLGVALAGLGVWWRYPGVTGLGAALIVLVLAGFASVLVPAPMGATRTVRPHTVHRLGSCTGSLELTSRSRFSITLDATELVAGTPVVVDVPVLAPGERITVNYPIPTTRRGVLHIGPLVLHRHGLAGLATSRTVLGDTVDVHVVPRILPVRGLPTGVRRGHVGADERVERGGTDLIGLREYVPGDDLRRLHWATSARTGTLMVREDADPARPHLAVVLDDSPTGHPTPDTFEDAVEVAASLVTAAMSAGHPVRLQSTSGTLNLEAPAGATDLGTTDSARILEALANLQPADAPTAPLPVPTRDLDVLVTICGRTADLPPLLLEAARATIGIILTLDTTPSTSALGAVLLLHAPQADALITTWNTVVAR